MGRGRQPSNAAQYSIAIISDEESTFPEICRFLAQTIGTILATNEEQIQAVLSAPQLDGIVLDLDSIGDDIPPWIPALGISGNGGSTATGCLFAACISYWRRSPRRR